MDKVISMAMMLGLFLTHAVTAGAACLSGNCRDRPASVGNISFETFCTVPACTGQDRMASPVYCALPSILGPRPYPDPGGTG